MENLESIFRQVLNPSLFQFIYQDEKGNKFIRLEESSNEKGLSEIVIKNIPENACFFSLDTEKLGLSNPILNGEDNPLKGIHKGCDGVLIYQSKDKVYVVIFELKSFDTSGFEFQLMNAKVWIDYLTNLLFTFYDKDLLFERNYKFYLFHLKEYNRLEKSVSASKGNRFDIEGKEMKNPLFKGIYVRHIP